MITSDIRVPGNAAMLFSCFFGIHIELSFLETQSNEPLKKHITKRIMDDFSHDGKLFFAQKKW